MKEINEYQSVADLLEDAIREGLVLRLKPVKYERVGVIKDQILDYLRAKDGKMNVQGWMLNRTVRADHYPQEFKLAITELVRDQQITEEKQVTGTRGRPAVYYRLFEH